MKDPEAFLEACHEYDMTVNELFSHILEWHLNHGKLKELVEEAKRAEKEERKKNKNKPPSQIPPPNNNTTSPQEKLLEL